MTIQSVTVISGSAGNIGPPGPPGPSYDATSITQQNVSVGPHTFTTQVNLAYLPGARCRMSSAADPVNNWMEGPVTSYINNQLIVNVQLLSATRDGFAHADWLINIAGQPGQAGQPGLSGTSGTNGNTIWHGTAAPTGTNPPSPTDGDWYMQFNPATPGGPAYLWGPYNHLATNKWGTAGVLLATGPAGPQGVPGPTGPAGPQGQQGVTGAQGPSGSQGVPGNQGPAGPTGPGYIATTTSSLTIGIGSTSVVTQPGLAYNVGARIRFAAFSAPTNWMEGLVTAYAGASLTVNVDLTAGAGTFANWTINVTGERGQQGPAGAAGAGSGDMIAANNLSDLTNMATARTNLQLATIANTGNYNDLSNRPDSQRSVTASPITIAAGDAIINCNITGAGTCALPASSTRNGRLLVFKDVGGKFGANNLTITPAGAERIDGLANIVGRTNYGRIVLRPMNDGVNSGWSLET